MADKDVFFRFLFEAHDIRGELVCLSNSYQEAVKTRNYPLQVKVLLGECMAASVLMSGTLKFDGILSIQARGTGPVSLIMAECSHYRKVRAVAQWSEEAELNGFEDGPLKERLGEGVMAITIEPDQGQRYQGVVPMDAGNLGRCLEAYFEQSEQLETCIVLFADEHHAAGLMLQKLPARESSDVDAWTRLCHLARSVTFDELKTLSGTELLHRLFHEEEIRVFPEETVEFACSCSRERTEAALKAMGEAEVYQILDEQNRLAVDCHFCAKQYEFSRQDVDLLFKNNTLQ